MKKILFILSFLVLVGCLEKDEATISLDGDISILEPIDKRLELKIPILIGKNEIGTFPISIKVKGISATEALDYEYTPKDLFVSGSNTEIEFSIIIINDSLYEGNESFEVSISTTEDEVSIGTKLINILIEDSTPEPEATFDISNATFIEGGGSKIISLILSQPDQYNDHQISFSVSGLATQSTNTISGDFELSKNSFFIPAGGIKDSITIYVLQDGIKEGGESIVLTLIDDSLVLLGEQNKMSIIIPGENSLNDTGIEKYYSDSGYENSETDYPDQDASMGADADSNETFDGHASFSFTKLDSSGNPINSAGSQRCILDEKTGLVWESKREVTALPDSGGLIMHEFISDAVDASKRETDDDDYTPYPFHNIHQNWQSSNYRYFWFNDNEAENGGSTGVGTEHLSVSGYPINGLCAYPNETSPSYSSNIKSCNTKQYVQYMNLLGVCGFKDWRLPNIEELRSIVSYRHDGAAFDEIYFPNASGYEYMSSTPHADAGASAWCINASSRRAQLCNKQMPYRVRLVRSNQ